MRGQIISVVHQKSTRPRTISHEFKSKLCDLGHKPLTSLSQFPHFYNEENEIYLTVFLIRLNKYKLNRKSAPSSINAYKTAGGVPIVAQWFKNPA